MPTTFFCALAKTPMGWLCFDFGDENDKDIRDAAIARFYTHYPNVKVTDRFTPNSSWADYYDKLAEQIASGNAPDLIHIATEGMQLAIQRNLIIPLDTYAKSEISAKDLLNDIDPVLLKGFTVNVRSTRTSPSKL